MTDYLDAISNQETAGGAVGAVAGTYLGDAMFGPVGGAVGGSLGEPIWTGSVWLSDYINTGLNNMIGANVFPLINLGGAGGTNLGGWDDENQDDSLIAGGLSTGMQVVPYNVDRTNSQPPPNTNTYNTDTLTLPTQQAVPTIPVTSCTRSCCDSMPPPIKKPCCSACAGHADKPCCGASKPATCGIPPRPAGTCSLPPRPTSCGMRPDTMRSSCSLPPRTSCVRPIPRIVRCRQPIRRSRCRYRLVRI